MQQQVESELKWALTAPGHARLATELPRLLGPPLVLEQDNRFLDSADLRLRRAGMNLRLRSEITPAGSRLLVTAKRRRNGVGTDLHRHDEWEQTLAISLEALLAAPDRIVQHLTLPEPVAAVLGAAPLMDQGGFANLRWEFHSGAELLCLDQTRLPSRIDYELEIETPEAEATRQRWSAQCRAWGVDITPQTQTKFARFLADGPGRPG